jgi:mono/diheme cytochrome c family protein
MRRVGALTCVFAVATTAGFTSAGPVVAGPVGGHDGLLPEGAELGGFVLEVPRQVLTVEALGSTQNFLVALGNLAFSSPQIMGGLARRVGLSCATCHEGGDVTAKFFIPGHSAKPGSFDVTGALFNPKTDDRLVNPVDIPSLRGVRFTAPFGRDGRFGTLADFTRNAIVNEFGGAEPAPIIVDALVAYTQQFDFLRSPHLDDNGRLRDDAPGAARRGQALFIKPFDQMGGQSCASCHIPTALYVDRRSHDVGTGGLYDTPSLLNIRFTRPYFHDGRADTLREVVEHFDAFFELGLTDAEAADMTAYLEAIGDVEEPWVMKTLESDMAELEVFSSVLDVTLEDGDYALTRLAVDTINGELGEIQERWYRPEDHEVQGIVGDWIVQLRHVEGYAGEGEWDRAREALAGYRELVRARLPAVQAAERRSLYDPKVLEGYLAELRGRAPVAEPQRSPADVVPSSRTE